MLTWILIAIIIAAIFGVIDLTKWRPWLVAQYRKYQPQLQEWLQKIIAVFNQKK